MAYDFNNIKTIVRNGTELSKITNSAGTIIWQKLYIWKRYSINTTVSSTYTEYNSLESISRSGNVPYDTSDGYLYKTKSFNSNTGTFTLSSKISATIGSRPLVYWINKQSDLSTVQYYTNQGYRYFYGNNNDCYYIRGTSLSDITCPFTLTRYYGAKKTTYSQGSYIDLVTSTNSNAYPTDGISGDYWYVKQ